MQRSNKRGLAPLWGGLGLCVLMVGQAHAHGEADDALPPDPGVRWRAAAALSRVHAFTELPSQRLRGFLLQGDAGTDRRDHALEHATLGTTLRIHEQLGAVLTLGKHGADAAHVEEAWLQWRHDGDDDAVWRLSAGRQTPALGAAMTQAGHMDRFALMPVAKQAAFNGDWIDDGLQATWTKDSPQGRWRADVGLWRGEVFPGGQGAPPVPSLHLGWSQGPWAVDGWAVRFSPDGRGSRINSLAGHSHTSPDCSTLSKDTVCFNGRSTVLGVSVVWHEAESTSRLPFTLSAAGWWRDDRGGLTSANGAVNYTGKVVGGWAQALWDVHSQFQTGVRLERVGAKQRLQGAGATLVATDTALNAYTPVTRVAGVLNWQAHPRVQAGLELDRERGLPAVGNTARSVSYGVLRVVMSLEGNYALPH